MWVVRRTEDTEAHGPRWIAKEVRTDGAFPAPFAYDMLRAEIDVLKRTEHRGLLRVDDAVWEDGHLYMIAEYVDGVPLDEVIRKQGALPEEKVRDIALQLCDILGYLHSRRRSVIYRDLKPANIMLRKDGSVVLIDFGTALPKGRKLAPDKIAMGTKGFAAPEQYTGAEGLSDETDVYALGKTLIALAGGGKTSLRSVRHLSPAFREILRDCTRRRRGSRYRSVAEVYVALQNGKARVKGRAARAEVERRRRCAEVNGVLRIGKRMPTKRALSYADIEIPLDEAMTDVRIGLDSNLVNAVTMDGFAVETDVMVTLRENYCLI